MKRALVLTDGKAGHENQSKALARALGCEAEIVEVHFKSKAHKALSYVLDHLGIRTLGLLEIKGRADLRVGRDSGRCGRDGARPSLSVVLGTGSGTFYAAKAMAKRLGVPCGVVLYPRGYDLASFDAILAPAFDRPKPAPNVIEIPANLVAADAAFYEKGVAAFREHYLKTTGRPSPDASRSSAISAVIVGGPNKCSTMTVDWMKRELDEIFGGRADLRVGRDSGRADLCVGRDSGRADLCVGRDSGGCGRDGARPSLWVTTSRRTPPEVEALVDSYPWDYKLLYSRDHFNPIPAFVALAQKLYVTAESTGMLSEACTFGSAEVHPLDNLKPGPHKFRRFMEGLVAAGCERGDKLDLAPLFARAQKLLGLE